MELLKSLEWRYASKRMNGETVPQEKVEAILKAIQLAPTSMGLQPFNVLVITDKELKEKIKAVAYNQPQITESSHLLVFTAWDNVTEAQVDEYMQNTAKTRNVSLESLDGFKASLMQFTQKSPEQNFIWTARQAYIAFGTAIAAAAELRVDATPMEGFDNQKLDELLNLKEKGLKSVTLLPLGYRDTDNDWLAALPKVRREKEQLFIMA